MAASDQAHASAPPTPPAPRRRSRLAPALALAALVPLSAPAQERLPGAASAPPAQDAAALRDEIERLRGRIDELGIELQRQDRLLGALAARAPDATPQPPPARPAIAAAPAQKPLPAESSAPALIVMVGNDGALTLEGRPASLPTLGYALRAASGNDPTRRVVVGAEPKASPARVGEVVSALSQSGFGRITITGP
ncbi:MAG: ExbD/TolR family protein [Janthinobacterium lividum]